jgi:hypothetical protein
MIIFLLHQKSNYAKFNEVINSNRLGATYRQLQPR